MNIVFQENLLKKIKRQRMLLIKILQNILKLKMNSILQDILQSLMIQSVIIVDGLFQMYFM